MGLQENLTKMHKNLQYIKYLVFNGFGNLGSTTLNGKIHDDHQMSNFMDQQ